MDRIKIFEEEIGYIQNSSYQENVKTLINLLPDYFFDIPASSTGKYHPSFALGEGGLVRHTMVAVRIGYELLYNDSIGYSFNSDEKDLMLISLLIHDGLKSGLNHEKYTRFDHPLLISQFVKDHQEMLTFNQKEIELICSCLESHMGQWNTDKHHPDVVLPLPHNKYQRFVHMCDFLASRKFLDVAFENQKIKK